MKAYCLTGSYRVKSIAVHWVTGCHRRFAYLPFLARSACSANTVYIHRCGDRKIEVDHEGYAFEVYATRHQICTDQEPYLRPHSKHNT